jgi:hypothetical protein
MTGLEGQALTTEEAIYQAFSQEDVHFMAWADRARERIDLIHLAGGEGPLVGDPPVIQDAPAAGDHPAALETVKLPTLKLPSFNGNPLDWNAFWQSFQSAVDNRPIPAVQKMNYLVMCLQDAAKTAIKGYSVSSENYPLVVEMLRGRFGDQTVLAQALQAELINLPSADDSISSLRMASEAIERVCRQLTQMGQPEDNPFMLTTVKSKLPRGVLTELVRQERRAGGWTMREWREALQELVAVREEVQRCTQAVKRAEKGTNSSLEHSGKSNSGKGKGTEVVRTFAVTQSGARKGKDPPPCLFCEGTHWASDCTKVTTMGTNARWAQGARFLGPGNHGNPG